VSLAVVVISHNKRLHLLPTICESILTQRPDEFVIVGDSSPPPLPTGVRWLTVSPVTLTTVDALIKRDVGWMATKSEHVCYLSDDHALSPGFVHAFLGNYEYQGAVRGGPWDGPWDILCPQRWCVREGAKVALNMGQSEGYVAGHGGIYRRRVNQELPWMAGSHHRNWDVFQTQAQVAAGFRLAYAEADLSIQDLEPERSPWL
jgi:hypothetical protein